MQMTLEALLKTPLNVVGGHPLSRNIDSGCDGATIGCLHKHVLPMCRLSSNLSMRLGASGVGTRTISPGTWQPGATVMTG